MPGWFSCVKVNRHRKQLPGVSRAGSGLPASPGQPALLFPAGSWRELQTHVSKPFAGVAWWLGTSGARAEGSIRV